ncbi:hypothetical protein [Stutzerimonas azotifigens]|uniref:Translation initiation factor 2 n=1 Tax=Stutzerimonas azotifigens TaxID=291995 RepID=A0ABR5YXY5_9GAMM|nr:hypothetical protein [Stutzerimonas azotifigens]MBA1272784.1 hypothetical protein [Stutzerimonas azotifigens]
MKRWIFFLLLVPMLVACDNADEPMSREAVSEAASQPPALEPVESEPEAQPAPTAPADPAGETAPTSMPPAIEIESPSLPDPQADTPPAVAIRLPDPDKPTPPVATAKSAKQAVKDVELAASRLDLSLPDDWVDEFVFAEEEVADGNRVLPPLFTEPRPQLQMSGRLLSGSTYEDNDKFDGAEIQFELKR